MTEAAKLASRPWWRWEPGMRYRGESWGVEWGWVRVSERPAHIDALNARGPDIGVQLEGLDILIPDLDDAATVGCLEARLCAAWPGARISIDLDPWADPERHQVPCAEVSIYPAPGEPCRSFFGRGPRARAEAIIAALEAAPKTGGAS